MYSQTELNEWSYRDLQKSCLDKGLLASGTKVILINRLIQHQEEEEGTSKTSTTLSVATMMSQMMESQAEMLRQLSAQQMEDRRQNAENQKLILELVKSHVKVEEAGENVGKSEHLEGVDDPKTIVGRLDWLFGELELRIGLLEKEIAGNAQASSLKDTMKLVQLTEEKVSHVMYEKLTLLKDRDVKQHLLDKFLKIQEKIYKLRKHALQICDNEEEARKMSQGLPPGVAPPVFHGDPNEFPVWWESFDALVHQNCQVSKFYKYRYLRQAMKGDATHCLDGFSPLVEKYGAALEHVKKRFGQPRKIVRHIMKSILEIPPLISDDCKQLQKHYDTIVGKIHDLESYVKKVERPLDALVIPILESKLPKILKQSWERELINNYTDEEFATMDRYIQWYSKEVRARETFVNTKDKILDSKGEYSDGRKGTYSSLALPSALNKGTFCLVCEKGSHKVAECFKFKKSDSDQRWKFAKDLSLCFLCLHKFHPGVQCEVVQMCGVNGCNKRHNPLLHYNDDNLSSLAGTCSTIKCLVSKQENFCRIMPSAFVFATNGKKSSPVRIAFDTMCQDSFISERIAKELKLVSNKQFDLEVEGFGGGVSNFQTCRVDFSLSPVEEKGLLFPVTALVKTGRICAPMEAVDIDFESCFHLKNLQIADRFPRGECEVDILIGLNHYLHLVSGEIIRHPSESDRFPAAMKTVFGYVIIGCNPCSKRPKKRFCMVSNVKIKSEIEIDLERFWSLESIGIIDRKIVLTNEEKQAVEQFNKTIKYENSRYSVGLPFKDKASTLKNNYFSAKKQLESLERRIKTTEDQDAYDKAITEYVNLGFAREASANEVKKFADGSLYYVPHHAVIKRESLTTKLRVVFNASSPDPVGHSLNDSLLAGPPLQPDLGQVLIRFRTHYIALMADIQKMFCQTNIDQKDYCYQLFLWRNFDLTINPKVFIMTSLMFGVKPSPFLAMQTIKHHVSRVEMQERFPKACNAMEKLYVDDLCYGGDSEEEVINLIKESVALMELGGWKLTKFISNSKKVMKSVPEKDRRTTLIIPIEENELGSTKALGIGWNVEKDCFQYQLSKKNKEPALEVTKRHILSKVFQIFDVLGFYAAFTIRAKILLQELWKLKVSWDEKINTMLADRFRKWEEEFIEIERIQIPRLVLPQLSKLNTLELHGFGDASEQAYGAMIFIRAVDTDGRITVSFLIAKTRVAPLNQKSLPRLELLSAHAASKLMDYVMEALEIKVNKIQFWLDSEIALGWIRKPSNHWKTFVSNRVQDIHDKHDPGLWSFITGNENPADLLTRGMTIEELSESRLYWKGPEWLSSPCDEWPSHKSRPEVPSECMWEERKLVTACIATVIPDCHLWKRYEKFIKLVRVVAHILKFNKSVPRREGGNLNRDDLQTSENTLLRCCQRIHFPKEFESLQKGEPLESSSSILSLDPIFDDRRRLLVVGGRLQNSLLPEETKHQIILPCKELLVEKLILHYHEQENHAPIETTLCILRERYWIVHGRQEVSKAVNKCLDCQHKKTTSLQAKMGVLPSERVQIAPAFSHIGLDFTGALYIKEGKQIRKSYVCVFTCAHSRMVHFELTLSMETEEFLNALKRMLNRRGICQSVTSDNQSTFKKAAKIVKGLEVAKTLVHMLDVSKLERFCANRGIKWSFITERSPFRGGYWERLNRSLKEPLRKILGKALLNYSEMYTVLTGIEASINQRPLTYQGTDPGDLRPITPAHLALGRPLGALPDIPTRSAKLSERYRYIQNLQQHFWKRWTREYLPMLQTRNKWQINGAELKVNDIVLITEENTKRNTWPLARVIEIIPGRDGIPRTARLQTTSGVFTRPYQRLHLFEKFEPSLITQDSNSIPVVFRETEKPNKQDVKEGSSQRDTEDIAPHSSSDVELRESVSSQGGEDVTKPPYRSRFGRICRKPPLEDFVAY